MTGKKIDALEAERIGLINTLYAPEELEGATRALADHLMSISPVAVGLCKMAIDRSAPTLEANLEFEAQAQSICFTYTMEKLSKSGQAGKEQ